MDAGTAGGNALSVLHWLEQHLYYLMTCTEGDTNAHFRALREELRDRCRHYGLDV